MVEPPDLKKPKLIGAEYEQLKERLKETKKKLLQIPRLRMLAAGENASFTINNQEEDRTPIFLRDVQYLLMFSMVGQNSPHFYEKGWKPWFRLEKFTKIAQTVVLVVEGLSINHYLDNKASFKYLTSKFNHKLELITSPVFGGSISEQLAGVPLSTTQKYRLIKQFGTLEAAASNSRDVIRLIGNIFPIQEDAQAQENNHEELPKGDKFSRLELILSPYQLIEENYPIPLKEGSAKRYANYILTKNEYTEVSDKSPMFGLDCEMCMTSANQSELTRISIVDENLKVVYDTLVKPDNKITDYLTQYSGITEEMLKDVTTNLADVQKYIQENLPSNAILVGQSLNSDMHALKMMHPYVIDTSVIFNLSGSRYQKTKLKVLAQAFLKEQIQDSKNGHCSTQDSQTSMKLVKLKLANNLYYGDAVLTARSEINKLKSFQKNYNKTHWSKPQQNQTLGTLIFNHINKLERKSASIVGCSETMNDYSRILKNSSLSIMDDKNYEKSDNIRLTVSETNKEAVKRSSEILLDHALNLCHLKLNENQITEENLATTVKTVDEWVKTLWTNAAMHGLVCIIFGGVSCVSNGACFLNIKKMVDFEEIQDTS